LSLMQSTKELSRKIRRAPSFALNQLREDGIEGVKYTSLRTKSDLRTHILGNPGTSVWEKEWDILIILDACRVDLMHEVINEYPFLPDSSDDLDTIYSVASRSAEWLSRTFSNKWNTKIQSSAYVTGNAFTAKMELESTPAVLTRSQPKWN